VRGREGKREEGGREGGGRERGGQRNDLEDVALDMFGDANRRFLNNFTRLFLERNSRLEKKREAERMNKKQEGREEEEERRKGGEEEKEEGGGGRRREVYLLLLDHHSFNEDAIHIDGITAQHRSYKKSKTEREK